MKNRRLSSFRSEENKKAWTLFHCCGKYELVIGYWLTSWGKHGKMAMQQTYNWTAENERYGLKSCTLSRWKGDPVRIRSNRHYCIWSAGLRVVFETMPPCRSFSFLPDAQVLCLCVWVLRPVHKSGSLPSFLARHVLWRERVQPMRGTDYHGAADAIRTRCFAFVFRVCLIWKIIGTRLRFGKGVFCCTWCACVSPDVFPRFSHSRIKSRKMLRFPVVSNAIQGLSLS